jgi:hypothetical protein
MFSVCLVDANTQSFYRTFKANLLHSIEFADEFRRISGNQALQIVSVDPNSKRIFVSGLTLSSTSFVTTEPAAISLSKIWLKYQLEVSKLLN